MHPALKSRHQSVRPEIRRAALRHHRSFYVSLQQQVRDPLRQSVPMKFDRPLLGGYLTLTRFPTGLQSFSPHFLTGARPVWVDYRNEMLL